MIRFIFITAIVLVAIICTPAALAPGVNSADLIVALAPFAVVVVVALTRGPWVTSDAQYDPAEVDAERDRARARAAARLIAEDEAAGRSRLIH